eukprot:8486235-Pyramimonas_sp.AAC.1
MNPAVEDEQLKDARRFQRLDLMIATNLIENLIQCERIATSFVIILISFNRSLAWNAAPRTREGS